MTLRAAAGSVPGGSLSTSTNTVSTDTTLVSTQYSIFVDAIAAPRIITLPTAATSRGRIYVIKKIDTSANSVTIKANGSELIDGTNTKVISTQNTAIMLQSDGTFWWILSAN